MYANKNILITGASSGIGESMARILANHTLKPAHIVLVARRTDRLEKLKSELQEQCPITVIGCDLLDRDQTDSMLKQAQNATGGIDILINNAGFGDVSRFWKADMNKLDRMVALNITAPVYLAHQLLPTMIERDGGGILNISSGFGLVWMPRFATYVGTKHFITGWTESLRAELSKSNVHISQLCPGPVATEFVSVAQERDTEDIPAWAVISSDKCAQIGINGFERNKALIVPGLHMRIGMALAGAAPRSLVRFAMEKSG